MFDYEALSPADDAAARGLWMQAFDTPSDYWADFTRRLGAENLRVLRSCGEVVALLGVYRAGQWFGGRCVPCGGVAGVAVAPEHRQRGAGRFLLTSMLQELQQSGVAVATLYPSTQPVYRSIGFEQAGSRCHYELPLHAIGLRDRELPARRVCDPSLEDFAELHRRRAQLEGGHLERSAGLWERLFHSFGAPHYAYVVEEQGRPEGYLIYHLQSQAADPTRIIVRDWCAHTPGAARRLWTLIADHGSVVDFVKWFGPLNDPMLAHTAECRLSFLRVQRWMLRIVDVARALALRGYPPISAELELSIDDPLIAGNSGNFVLTVDEGRPTVRRGGRGDVRCGIRGLAPLYTGMFAPDVLARLGWITGDPASLRVAGWLFGGPSPWLPEYF